MRPAFNRWVTALVFVLSTTAAAGRAAPPGTAPATAATQDLRTVDNGFFAAYERSAREVLAIAPPAILVLGGKLVLYRGGNRQELPLLPPLFNELKTVSHVTLALFAIITPAQGQPLTREQRADLQRFGDLIPKAQAAIRHVGLTPQQVARQEQILTASLALIDQALRTGQVSDTDLTQFCRTMRPLIDVNIREAVQAYLDAVNRRTTALLGQFTAAERQSFLVIVTGVHQARIDNAVMQYFERLLEDPAPITQRLIYAENVSDEAGAVHLLGIHVMARRVGKAFFDDPYYMNRDLFAAPASQYVPTMQLPALAH